MPKHGTDVDSRRHTNTDRQTQGTKQTDERHRRATGTRAGTQKRVRHRPPTTSAHTRPPRTAASRQPAHQQLPTKTYNCTQYRDHGTETAAGTPRKINQQGGATVASTSVTAIHDGTQQPPAAVTASDRQWRGPWRTDAREMRARERARGLKLGAKHTRKQKWDGKRTEWQTSTGHPGGSPSTTPTASLRSPTASSSGR